MSYFETGMHPYAVSEIVRHIRYLCESDEILQDVWIRGEIANFSRAASGHSYFSLKDGMGVLKCALFRGNAIRIPALRDGMQILAHGKVSIYEARSEMQLIVDQVEEVGIGELFQQFLALKQELEALGYFDLSRKRPIPIGARTIGIVTSLNAAALRDMIRTLRLRWPLARVIIAPTLVQGDDAPPQVAQAIDLLNRQGEAEIIIVARGGGSLEDLWAFNDRRVADAIARSRIPIVSGVGHETDFTITDFVADLRAATPTAAAVAVTPDISTIRAAIAELQGMLFTNMQTILEDRTIQITQLERRLQREHPRERYQRASQQVDDLTERLHSQIRHRLDLERERLSGAALHLQALSPLLTIARGFATITRIRDGVAVRAVSDVIPMEAIRIQVRDGVLHAAVTDKIEGSFKA
jgi:exodeoxyribonuclease VII large subunit